ncbi:MAG: hypothetical protein E2O39_17010 [Planctomycetota bacterium]|nr:MAG: hypothetical protein E2O39_17010 [Planctomycetota bacterium]
MTKNRFCWIWGVGAWGLTTALGFSVVMSRSRESGFLPWLGLSLMLFPPAGYLWGRIMWRWFGSKGRKMQPNQPTQTDGPPGRR